MVSGLYYINRQAEMYICLVNESADEVVIRDNELLGQHIPVCPDDMITLGKLLTVQKLPQDKTQGPTAEKLQLINDTVSTQGHLSSQQK